MGYRWFTMPPMYLSSRRRRSLLDLAVLYLGHDVFNFVQLEARAGRQL